MQTLVYRDALAHDAPLTPPEPGDGAFDASEWDAHRILTPDPRLLFRFSALTFNTHRIHYDLDYARDVEGYAAALEYFDDRLPALLELVQDDDLLVLCADHGCDPTWEGSDHTREHIPVLAYGAELASGSLGRRKTFADIGQSLATYFGLPPMDYGESFIPEIVRAA